VPISARSAFLMSILAAKLIFCFQHFWMIEGIRF